MNSERAIGSLAYDVAELGGVNREFRDDGTADNAPLDDVEKNTRAAWRKLGGLGDEQLREVADDAGEIRLRCEAALGQIDAEVAPAHRPEKGSATTEPSELAPLADVEKNTRAAWRKLGGLGDEQLREVADDAGEIRLRCEAALGQIDAELNPRGRPRKVGDTSNLTLDLRKPENRSDRAKWLAEYEAAGVADDQDPSWFEFTVPPGSYTLTTLRASPAKP